METDIKSLEEKISKLIMLCGNLHGENVQLRNDLAQAKMDAAKLKNNMQIASDKLELLLNVLPSA